MTGSIKGQSRAELQAAQQRCKLMGGGKTGGAGRGVGVEGMVEEGQKV